MQFEEIANQAAQQMDVKIISIRYDNKMQSYEIDWAKEGIQAKTYIHKNKIDTATEEELTEFVATYLQLSK